MINKNEYTYVYAICVLIFPALETTNFVVDNQDLWSTESFKFARGHFASCENIPTEIGTLKFMFDI